MTADGWTISEALEQFRRQGMPVDEAAFRDVVTVLRRAGKFVPCGEKPPGPQGGRGEKMHGIGELQRLHSALAPWLVVQGGDAREHTYSSRSS